MPVTLVIVALVLMCCVAAVLLARSFGLVYVGRTAAGWTSVHTVTLGSETMRVLEVEGTYQSATYLDERWCAPVFPYHELYDHLFDAWPAGDGPRSVAVLGGGGYALPRHLVAHAPQVERIDVVEIDPAIQRIARRYFLLDRLERTYGAEASGRLRLHVADAARWLAASDETFDVIINDCFFGHDPERSLMSAEAARLVRRHLNEGGLYLTNVISALWGPEARLLHEQMNALDTQFSHLWLYPCGQDDPTYPDNNVVIATNAPCTFPGAWSWPLGKDTP